jgi:hypothetical protein
MAWAFAEAFESGQCLRSVLIGMAFQGDSPWNSVVPTMATIAGGDRSGRTFRQQRSEKRNPHSHQETKASKKDNQAMVNLVVRAMNEAMKQAQREVDPRADDKPVWNIACSECDGSQCEEQNRDLEKISKIVCDLNILQPSRHRHRVGDRLGVYALSSHFLNATEKHGTAHRKRKQHHCQAGCEELDVICWHHDVMGLKTPGLAHDSFTANCLASSAPSHDRWTMLPVGLLDGDLS